MIVVNYFYEPGEDEPVLLLAGIVNDHFLIGRDELLIKEAIFADRDHDLKFDAFYQLHFERAFEVDGAGAHHEKLLLVRAIEQMETHYGTKEVITPPHELN